MDIAFREYETALLRRLSPEQKLRALETLRRTAWLLVEAGVRARQPDFTSAQVQAEVRRVMVDAPS